MKNIKIMRLVTGEDIIGNISESQGLITIKKAFGFPITLKLNIPQRSILGISTQAVS